MMINKRLIGTVPECKRVYRGKRALQWCPLCADEVTQGQSNLTFEKEQCKGALRA